MKANLNKMLFELGITDSYQEICRAYFTAKLIIAYNDGEDYADTLKASRKLHAAFAGYRQIISRALSDDNADQWAALCEALHTSGLDADMYSFFDSTVPNVVADWTEYLTHLPDHRDSTILIALIILLDSKAPTREEYAVHADACGKINLTYDRFQRCWNSVYTCVLADASHTPAPCISNAMRLYHQLYIPMTDLLTDYCRLYLSKDLTSEKQAIKGGRRRERTTIIAEGGKTTEDRELELALRNIAQAKPTDVIRALFYEGEIPPQHRQEAMEYLAEFMACGEKNARPGPKLLDWEQDAQVIVADVNKVAGAEIRALPFLHWWTFMAWFNAIGEGQLSTLVSLRDKLSRGKKLEKWEQEYYRKNKSRVDLKKRYSAEDLAEQERLKKLLSGGS